MPNCLWCRGLISNNRVCEKCGRRAIPGAKPPAPPPRAEQTPGQAATPPNLSNSERMARAGGSAGRVDAVSNHQRLERNAIAQGLAEDVHVDAVSSKDRQTSALGDDGVSPPGVVSVVARKVGPDDVDGPALLVNDDVVLTDSESESAAAEKPAPRRRKR